MKKSICVFLAAILAVLSASCGSSKKIKMDAPIPMANNAAKKENITKAEGDYYVATNGSDKNNGSFAAPFATVEKARDTIRALKRANQLPRGGITVCIKAGEYKVDGFVLEEEDSGTADCPITYRAYGDGEVLWNGGVTLKPEDFEPLSGEVKSRLSKDVHDKVQQIDLKKYNLTAENWGKIYAFGQYNTAEKYGEDARGPLYSELFFNDNRMTMARYPNGNAFLKTGKIKDNGQSKEVYTKSGMKTNADWATLKNPKGGTFEMDRKTSDRIKHWKNPKDAWMFGYFQWDWADSATPISAIDPDKKTVSTEYASVYGFKKDAPYYFFNVLEELDTQGEWYLDREEGMLYLYPPEELKGASVDLSITTNDLIQLKNADYITISGITIKGTRKGAIVAQGNHNTFRNCTIKNIAGDAITVTGTENRVIGNDISHTGKGGILLTGGDRATLTPANNTAENNLIHDWSEIYLTYQAGVALHGVGNRCANNELYNAPHEAITYSGNDHIIEYNIIHDVVLQSSDAGAIYAGRNWTYFGVVIRYNIIYNLGSGEFKPSGIYFDDALSGQTAYGNLLVNIPGNAFLLGGGRDLNVENNIIINAGNAIWYDDRGYDGVVNQGWFAHMVKKEEGLWKSLKEVPYQSDIWAKKYPNLSKVTTDFTNAQDSSFAANPSNSKVSGNLILDRKSSIGTISDAVNRYSKLEDNALFSLKEDPGFENMANGNYTLKQDAALFKELPMFHPIPFDKIGRYS